PTETAIAHRHYSLTSVRPIEARAQKTPATLSTAWLTRWNRADPVRPRSGDFGRKVGPCQGRGEAAGLRIWPPAPAAQRRARSSTQRVGLSAKTFAIGSPMIVNAVRASAVPVLYLLWCSSPEARLS